MNDLQIVGDRIVIPAHFGALLVLLSPNFQQHIRFKGKGDAFGLSRNVMFQKSRDYAQWTDGGVEDLEARIVQHH